MAVADTCAWSIEALPGNQEHMMTSSSLQRGEGECVTSHFLRGERRIFACTINSTSSHIVAKFLPFHSNNVDLAQCCLKGACVFLHSMQISALQAVVQRECEEREELLQALADLKAQRTPSGHQRLKHRQTK